MEDPDLAEHNPLKIETYFISLTSAAQKGDPTAREQLVRIFYDGEPIFPISDPVFGFELEQLDSFNNIVYRRIPIAYAK